MTILFRIFCFSFFTSFLFFNYGYSQIELTNLDLKYDYLKLTRISGLGKMLIEKCNKAGASFEDPITGQTLFKRSEENKLVCEPIIKNDSDNSCFNFTPRSATEKESEELALQFFVTGIFNPVFWLLWAKETNDFKTVSTIRQFIEAYKPTKLFIGINAKNNQQLKINGINSQGGFIKTKRFSTYLWPDKAKIWFDENKFVFRIREFMTKELTISAGTKLPNGKVLKSDFSFYPDLSCQ